MARFFSCFFFCCTYAWAACKLPELTNGPGAPPEPSALITAGHYHRAKALIPLSSTDPRSLWLLSRAEMGVGNLEVAVKLAEQAVSLEPGNAVYHVQLAAACGRLAEKASLFKQLSYARRAKKELDLAYQQDSTNPDALYGLLLYYYAAPGLIGGDKMKALTYAEEMTKIVPARGYLAQSELAKVRKDAAAEESFYQKSIQADSGYYDARVTLADFYLTQPQTNVNAAEEQACAALRIDGERIEAWRELVEVAVRNQCWDQMFTILDRAHKAVPDDRAADFAAGETLVRMNMHPKWAEEFLQAYLQGPWEGDSLPLVSLAHFRLGQILQRSKRQKEAEAEFAKARETDSSALEASIKPDISTTPTGRSEGK